jgi:hypothetical protein
MVVNEPVGSAPTVPARSRRCQRRRNGAPTVVAAALPAREDTDGGVVQLNVSPKGN